MNSQKIENLLNLANDATEEEFQKSSILSEGFNSESQTWEIIVKYSGNIKRLEEQGITVTPLLNNFAIVTLPKQFLYGFSQQPEIEYIEKPKRLFFAETQAKAVSCISSLQAPPYDLFGEGILVACIDSGINYQHKDFRNADGSTRILRIWDQSIPGNPPLGYALGTEYTNKQIDEALAKPTLAEQYALVPSRDLSGHGTGVMGIAAGNGAESGGANSGVATKSQLIVVKLGIALAEGFPRTTELIQAIDYVIRQSILLNMPIAINISFGNSYGSHEGNSLLDNYIDAVIGTGKNCICVGSGNEGSSRGHAVATVTNNTAVSLDLGVGQFETGINLQIWKSYEDQVNIYLTAPSGLELGPLKEQLGTQRILAENTQLLIYYGEPNPYSMAQEIFIDFIPINTYVDSGRWRLAFVGEKVVNGRIDLWLPGGNTRNKDTFFYTSSPDITLTSPSTSSKVITVGAYDSRIQSYADFSGRGFTRVTNSVKPDLVAPGVGITTTRAGGGYSEMTGTSFATPFVTGASALMMEWGIIRGNDPYLYGEKVKAYLRRGARQLPGFTQWPNPQVGYGALCVRDSLPR